MKAIIGTLCIAMTFCIHPVSGQNQISSDSIYQLRYDPVDSAQASEILDWLDPGINHIESFFNLEFQSQFDIFLFSERDSLDKQWQKDWNMPGFTSQCWMVASGIGYRLDILSPRIWKEQACEHDPSDTEATRKIIIHELVHVFHGQHNPSPTFDNIDNIDWLLEGMAVYVSGQLDEDRFSRAKKFILESEGPKQLANIWKGENRYGLAGSLVQYIDETYGRDTLSTLLSFTTATQVLEHLKTTEKELIQSWKQSVVH